MNLVKVFHPKNIFIALDQIDEAAPSYTLDKKSALRRVFSTMACVAVCLLLIHYMKYFSSFKATLALFSQIQGHDADYWLKQIEETRFTRLIGYFWWTFWHVIGYVVIPFFVIRLFIRDSFVNMGWRWNETHKHWLGYVMLLTPIIFFIGVVSQGQDFVNHYPFYKQASRSWFDFISWEILYLTQFVCLEFFFRGFFINSLRPAIGANAVWVMCVPYLMIHFPKLWLEATGAILFGLFLGILALRSRSIWGGFFVHAGVAVGMDVASLVAQNKIPTQLWPY